MPYRRPDIRVELENGFWAEIPARFRFKWDREIAESSEQGMDSVVALLVRAIRRWNVTDDQGNVLEITPETIGELYDDDVMTILNAVTESRKVRTPAEQADFTAPSTPGPADGETAPPPDSNGSA